MHFVKVFAVLALALVLGGAGLSSQGSGPYWCAMHPDIRGEAGAKCPLCGMPLVPRPASLDAYWLDLAPGLRAPVAGRAQRLRFLVRDPRTGAPVRSFTLLHERLLHLFIISHDLGYFAHVHPRIEADGTFEQSITLPHPGAYRLIADFAPDGAAPQLLQKTIVTAGYHGSLRAGPPPPVDLADKTVDGLRVRFGATEPIAGRDHP